MNQFLNNPEKVAEYLNEKSIKVVREDFILIQADNLYGIRLYL